MRESDGTLPVAEGLCERAISVPWFKHDDARRIERYAAAYRKVAAHAHKLMAETDL